MTEELHEPRFDLIAEFYDLDYEGLDADVEMYAELAETADAAIVELGCGTGRVLIPLAAKGYNVTGVDISEAMIDRARSKVQPDFEANTRFLQGDMREFHNPLSYDLAIFPMDTFRHLVTGEDQGRTLRKLHENLKPGGTTVIDLTNPDSLDLDAPNGEVVLDWVTDDPESLGSVAKFVSQVVDPSTQTQHITFLFDEADREGIVKRTPFLFSLHYFYPREMELLLERFGFVVEAIHGSYDLDPFDARSSRMIFVAKKPL